MDENSCADDEAPVAAGVIPFAVGTVNRDGPATETREVDAEGSADAEAVVGAAEVVGFNEASEPDISPPGIKFEFEPNNRLWGFVRKRPIANGSNALRFMKIDWFRDGRVIDEAFAVNCLSSIGADADVDDGAAVP